MCFPRGEFRIGSRDVYLGAVAGTPFGVRFLIRSRLFGDDEDDAARTEPVLTGPQH